MFELYTEAARRVIFWARFEVSEFGTRAIETEHLLLGLIRQDRALLDRLAGRPSTRRRFGGKSRTVSRWVRKYQSASTCL